MQSSCPRIVMTLSVQQTCIQIVKVTPRYRIIINQLPGASWHLSLITKALSAHSDLTYIFTHSIKENCWMQTDGVMWC